MAVSTVSNIAPEWELVWENESPGANFAAQTIDTGKAVGTINWIKIEGQLNTTTLGRHQYFEIPANPYTNAIYTMNIGNGGFHQPNSSFTPYIYSRQIQVDTALYDTVRLKFTTGYRKVTNATTAATSSTAYAIPLRIWVR